MQPSHQGRNVTIYYLLCTAWRKGIRRIWNLPYQAHSYLLPLLGGCLPVYDEICLRFVNFVRSCITHRSTLVKSIARYSIFYGRFSSPAGCNMLCCAQRYSCAVEDLLFTRSVRSIVDSCVCERSSDEQVQAASLLQECVMVRDGLARLPGVFTAGDMSDIVRYLCLCWLFCPSVYLVFNVYYLYEWYNK